MKLTNLYETVHKQVQSSPLRRGLYSFNAVLTDEQMNELQNDIDSQIYATRIEPQPGMVAELHGNPTIIKRRLGDVRILENNETRIYLYRGTETNITPIEND
jgi:hypothetical protein